MDGVSNKAHKSSCNGFRSQNPRDFCEALWQGHIPRRARAQDVNTASLLRSSRSHVVFFSFLFFRCRLALEAWLLTPRGRLKTLHVLAFNAGEVLFVCELCVKVCLERCEIISSQGIGLNYGTWVFMYPRLALYLVKMCLWSHHAWFIHMLFKGHRSGH